MIRLTTDLVGTHVYPVRVKAARSDPWSARWGLGDANWAQTASAARSIPTQDDAFAGRVATTCSAYLEVFEPEAAVVRRIFADRAAGITIREITGS